MLDERAYQLVLVLIPIAAGAFAWAVGTLFVGVVCMLVLAAMVLALWTPLRGWLGIPRGSGKAVLPTGRIGVHTRPGGRTGISTLRTKGLDTAVYTEGEFDAGDVTIE